MSLRINTNVSAMNTQRQLGKNSAAHAKSLERLSSGLKINRGADAPAQLQISENLRAQSAGLRQAIDNSEMGVSLLQTAEGALDEVSRALVNARQIAVHAANNATNDDAMLQADQQELDNIIGTVNRIAKDTQYGQNFLLDGSKAGNGVAVGKNLEFISGGPKAKTSDADGYNVTLTQAASRSSKTSGLLNEGLINKETQITIEEGGRSMHFKTMKGDSVEQTLNKLQVAIDDANLNVELVRDDNLPENTPNNLPQAITIQHKEYGSEHKFSVASSAEELFGEANISQKIQNGQDVQGQINGEEATGKGQILTGAEGSSSVEGIKVRYTANQVKGHSAPNGQEGMHVGTVTFAQNSLTFQTGANAGQTTHLSMKSTRASELANGVMNKSGFKSLSDIDVTENQQGAEDTIRILDKAIEEVAASRGELGAFQKNNLESNLNYLRIASENVDSSQSIIRDADIAEEMVTLTRNQIMSQSSMAMLAQANQKQQSVLQLIG